MPWLEQLLASPDDASAAAARRPIAETLAEERTTRAPNHDHWGWGGLYSSILTAALLRRSADIVLLPVQYHGAVRDAGAFVAIHLGPLLLPAAPGSARTVNMLAPFHSKVDGFVPQTQQINLM